MKRTIYVSFALCLILMGWSVILTAQQTQSITKEITGTEVKESNFSEGPTRILLILDASNSMRQLWYSKEKWSSAVTIVNKIADSLDKLPNVEVGLRVYGHQTMLMYKDCEDSRLEVSIGTHRAPVIYNKLTKIQPQGITPIAYSLEHCVADFPATPGRNVVVLITDGEESCEADPCRAARILQEAGITLKPMLIGMDIRPEAIADFNCIGKLYNAISEKEMAEKFNVLLNRVLSSTSLEVDLLDANGKPTETNVNMTFFDEDNDLMRYNFYHSLNDRGQPDSLFIDPIPTYRIVVNTLPPIVKEGVELQPNKHNIVEIPASQGSLQISMNSGNPKYNPGDKINVLVRVHDGYETLNVQTANSKVNYLSGKYDIDILTMPRMHVEAVEIRQSEITKIQVPAPANITINKSFAAIGALFVIRTGEEMEKIHDLDGSNKPETLSLQPGNYKVVFRSAKDPQMENSRELDFTVKEAEAQFVKL